MWCYVTIDEVDRIVQFCMRCKILHLILHDGFFESLLSDELVGPLDHYERILYYLAQISRIGNKYNEIPKNCIVGNIEQLEEVLDIFTKMDVKHKGDEAYSIEYHPAVDYLYIPTFIRKYKHLGMCCGAGKENIKREERTMLKLMDDNLKQRLEENYGWVGVYKLRCKLSDNSRYCKIGRLLKPDSDGLLYIGTSDYLPNRIVDLRKSLVEATKKPWRNSIRNVHVCGRKYSLPSVQEMYPLENMYVEILECSKENDGHFILEKQEFIKYENQYGEPPPFNEGRSDIAG